MSGNNSLCVVLTHILPSNRNMSSLRTWTMYKELTKQFPPPPRPGGGTAGGEAGSGERHSPRGWLSGSCGRGLGRAGREGHVRRRR